MKKCSVGGQAVMEGVMMKAPGGIAMAVRDAKGRIILDYKEYQTKAQKGTFYGLPIVRGVVAFVESLTIGMNTLTRSAELIGDPIDEEPTKFEKWLSEKLGKSVEKVVMGLAVILAVALSVGLFFLLRGHVQLVLLQTAEGVHAFTRAAHAFWPGLSAPPEELAARLLFRLDAQDAALKKLMKYSAAALQTLL